MASPIRTRLKEFSTKRIDKRELSLDSARGESREGCNIYEGEFKVIIL